MYLLPSRRITELHLFGGLLNRSSVLAAATLLLVMVGSGYWLLKSSKQESKTVERCDIVSSTIATNGAIRRATEGTRSVAVLGDSYTAGDGLKDKTRNWVHALGTEQGWSVEFDGIGMTGYLNGGYCGEDQFRERLADLVREVKPRLLLVQGGLNDIEFRVEEVETAAYNLLTSIPAGPEVLAIGPVDAPGRDGEQEVDAALSTAAKAAGIEYVSALEWDLEFLADRVHLTESGHARYAANVASALAS